jgi:prevent-host-death family protein
VPRPGDHATGARGLHPAQEPGGPRPSCLGRRGRHRRVIGARPALQNDISLGVYCQNAGSAWPGALAKAVIMRDPDPAISDICRSPIDWSSGTVHSHVWGQFHDDLYQLVLLCTIRCMSSSLTVSEARAVLPQLLDRVTAGEEVTITRHGKPVVVLVRPDSLRARRANEALTTARRIGDAIEQGRRSPLSATPTLHQDRADALIEDIRAGRSGGQ